MGNAYARISQYPFSYVSNHKHRALVSTML